MATAKKVTAAQRAVLAATAEEQRRLHVTVRAQLAERAEHRQRPRQAVDAAAQAIVDTLLDPDLSLIAAGWANGFVQLDVDEAGQVVVIPVRPRRPVRVTNPYLVGVL